MTWDKAKKNSNVLLEHYVAIVDKDKQDNASKMDKNIFSKINNNTQDNTP